MESCVVVFADVDGAERDCIALRALRVCVEITLGVIRIGCLELETFAADGDDPVVAVLALSHCAFLDAEDFRHGGGSVGNGNTLGIGECGFRYGDVVDGARQTFTENGFPAHCREAYGLGSDGHRSVAHRQRIVGEVEPGKDKRMRARAEITFRETGDRPDGCRIARQFLYAGPYIIADERYIIADESAEPADGDYFAEVVGSYVAVSAEAACVNAEGNTRDGELAVISDRAVLLGVLRRIQEYIVFGMRACESEIIDTRISDGRAAHAARVVGVLIEGIERQPLLFNQGFELGIVDNIRDGDVRLDVGAAVSRRPVGRCTHNLTA